MSSDLGDLAYLNGEWKPLPQCVVPVNTHALQYGTGCFEGIRGYWDGERVNLLFLREHFVRLAGNCRMLLMKCPPVDELCTIAVRLVRENRARRNVYVRPMVYKKGTGLGPELSKVEDGLMCYLIALDDYLDTSKGLNLCVSSWRRLSDNTIPTRAKATGGYLNSALAKSEAVLNGFDEAVFLNEHGLVSEGSAENIFIVRDGVLITPDHTAAILEGITRKAILELATELGIPTQVRAIARTELYRADEVFLVGTGCQVSWVRSIDRRPCGTGSMGSLTSRIMKAYESAVYNRDPTRKHWLTPV